MGAAPFQVIGYGISGDVTKMGVIAGTRHVIAELGPRATGRLFVHKHMLEHRDLK